MQRLALKGSTVVTQPGFIYWRGDNYLGRVEPGLLPYLYDTAGFLRNNIPLAFSSDSPVIDPSPWPGIFAAVTRRTCQGSQFPSPPALLNSRESDHEGVSLGQAMAAYTRGGARAEGLERVKGMIRPGMVADLAVLSGPLDSDQPDSILQTRSRLTIVGGMVLWRDGTV